MIGSPPRLIGLVPARNAALRLPALLDDAANFCDAVVALDDGSTDATRSVLETHPLVEVLLTNPQRETYAGWNDGENRNRLLEAAAVLEPDWLVFIDADERIDAEDAAACRAFVATDAVPGCVYAFECYRMLEEEQYDPNYEWAWRLFAFRPNQQVPDARLDFRPVPDPDVPTGWVPTTVRIKHYGDVGEEGRRIRLEKYRQADPARKFVSYWEHLSPAPTGPLPTWATRPDGLAAIAAPSRRLEPVTESRRRSKVVCLLPARNCEADLAGYFVSVGAFADAVVALDDGSTDATRQALDSQSLVATLLTNPRRDSYAGWDDSANRNRLLGAAGDIGADWIICVDADERIPPEDAAVLRRFIDDEAKPGFAYGLQRYRMIGDRGDHDGIEFCAWRLFAYERGQRFPSERLHFAPVPTSIPRGRWIETTIRMQHLGGQDEERRRARWQKYSEADPGRVWEDDYEYTRRPPGELLRWEPRSAGLPVLKDVAELDAPLLSVLAVVPSGDDDLRREMEALADELDRDWAELIVVSDGGVGEARNRGLRRARGDYVVLLDSIEGLDAKSLTALVEEHERGHAMVTADVSADADSLAGRAAYVLDHAATLSAAPGEALSGPPALCSFAREPLLSVGGFREGEPAGGAAVAAEVLWDRGFSGARASGSTLVDRSSVHTLPGLVARSFTTGVAVGRAWTEDRDAEGHGSAWRLARYIPGRAGLLVQALRRSETTDPRVAAIAVGALTTRWAGTCCGVVSGLLGRADTIWRTSAGEARSV